MANSDLSGDTEAGGGFRGLHGGRHAIRRGAVAHDQRERLLGAMATLVGERGYNGTTVELISETAAVSNRTFYEHFTSRQACFAAAYEALDDYLAGIVVDAVGSQEEWPERVAAAARALISFLSSRPALARLYLVESVVVGEPMVELRERSAERLISLLEPGRSSPGLASAQVVAIEEGVVGGIVTLLARRVAAGEASELERYTPAVIEFALAPYIGLEAARSIAARP